MRTATGQMDSILVIEHNGGSQKILHRLFSPEGYVVEVVPDGTVATENSVQPTGCRFSNRTAKVRQFAALPDSGERASPMRA
jgi:CheY-like chemotaxis protein